MSAKKNLGQLLPADLYELTTADLERVTQEEAMGIVPPEHAALSQVAKVVDPKLIRTPLVQGLIRRLLEAAGSQQQKSKQGGARRMLVGLAAPQIGESWRVIVVDTKIGADRKHAGHLECFINPEIVWRTRETEEGREGCFSAGPVWGLVRRPIAVKIRAFSSKGEQIERVLEGFTARIMQHEIDHLEGIRFPDRISSDKKRHWVHAEEIPLYPENIHRWPRICTKQRWEVFKEGKIEI